MSMLEAVSLGIPIFLLKVLVQLQKPKLPDHVLANVLVHCMQ